MTSILITNIGQLVTNDPNHDGTKLGLIKDAALLIARHGKGSYRDALGMLEQVLTTSGKTITKIKL